MVRVQTKNQLFLHCLAVLSFQKKLSETLRPNKLNCVARVEDTELPQIIGLCFPRQSITIVRGNRAYAACLRPCHASKQWPS
jgi:hypothetical protein